MNYRPFATSNWTEDTILSMSPEQKLIFLYLHTSPFTTACGIFPIQPITMGFQIGLIQSPFSNALKGLCAAFPDYVAADWDTMEVALLQYPRQLLITANARAMAVVDKDIQQVRSQELLKAMIAKNSAGLSAPYLAQLRRLQIKDINERKAPNPLSPVIMEVLPSEEPIVEPKKKSKAPVYAKTVPDQDDILEVQKDLMAYKKAAEFLRKVVKEMNDSTFPGQDAESYFLYRANTEMWIDLVLPDNVTWQHKWIAKHAAGVRRWHQNPLFKTNKTSSFNNQQAPAQAVAAPQQRKNPHQ